MFAREREWCERASEPANAKHGEHCTGYPEGDPDDSQRRLGSPRPIVAEESAGHDRAEHQGLQDDPALTSRAERRHVHPRVNSQAVSVRRGRRAGVAAPALRATNQATGVFQSSSAVMPPEMYVHVIFWNVNETVSVWPSCSSSEHEAFVNVTFVAGVVPPGE